MNNDQAPHFLFVGRMRPVLNHFLDQDLHFIEELQEEESSSSLKQVDEEVASNLHHSTETEVSSTAIVQYFADALIICQLLRAETSTDIDLGANRHHNSQLPISQPPAEILTEIFRLLRPFMANYRPDFYSVEELSSWTVMT